MERGKISKWMFLNFIYQVEKFGGQYKITIVLFKIIADNEVIT